jgi:hypothetical protein
VSAEDAVFVQMEKVGWLRGYSGQLRNAIKAAKTALDVGDATYAAKLLGDALAIQVPERS